MHRSRCPLRSILRYLGVETMRASIRQTHCLPAHRSATRRTGRSSCFPIGPSNVRAASSSDGGFRFVPRFDAYTLALAVGSLSIEPSPRTFGTTPASACPIQSLAFEPELSSRALRAPACPLLHVCGHDGGCVAILRHARVAQCRAFCLLNRKGTHGQPPSSETCSEGG